MNVRTFFKAPKNRGRDLYARSRRTVYQRAQGRCEARIANVCTGTGEHVHHVRRRSQGGSDGPSNLLLLCRACHDWTHANPADARTLGLLARMFDPAPAVGMVVPATRLYDQDADE